MKVCVLILMLFLYPPINAQNPPKKGNTTFINKYLSLVKTEKGYIFKDDKGNTSVEYTYVYLNDYGMIETTIVLPPDPSKPIEIPTNRCYGYDNSVRRDFHVFDLMKELTTITEYAFTPFDELTWANLRDGKVSDVGYAVRDGKIAMISNNGKFLTNFKYSSWIEDDNKPILNGYVDKGKSVIVVLDKYTGNEIFATKDSLVHYWNPKNHIVKTKRGNYLLTYNSQKHKVTQEFSHLIGLPFNSPIFTFRDYVTNQSGFIDLKGNRITPKTELVPQTNFYNGHCIVMEIIKEEQRYNYYKEPLPRNETRVFKLVDEQFETIKLLPEVTGASSSFNKYGQCIVYGLQRDSSYVIDYNGNTIIQPTLFPNWITEVNEGLYEITDKTYPPTTESRQQENFYNQKGEKVINGRTFEMANDFQFKTGLNENYLTSYGYKYITLSKDNIIVKSEY